MNNSKISIIVPIYNDEKYLEQCINSILNQTEPSLEIILIDDGSTDCSNNIINNYAKKDQRIKVSHQKNKGVSTTRNRGIKEATGEYIAFIDANDYVEKTLYHEAYNIMKDGDLDLLIWNFKEEKMFTTINNQNFPKTCTLDSPENINYAMASVLCPYMNNMGLKRINGMGVLWNKLFKTSIIKDNNIQFLDGIILYEDVYFMFNYMKYVKKMKFLNNYYYHYRILSNSMTRKYKPNLIKSNDILFNNLKKDYDGMTKLQKKAYWCRVARCLCNILTENLYNKENVNRKKGSLNNLLNAKIIYKDSLKYSKLKYLKSSHKLYILLIRCKLFNTLEYILTKKI